MYKGFNHFFKNKLVILLFLIVSLSAGAQGDQTLSEDTISSVNCGNLSKISLCIWSSDSTIHFFDKVSGNSGQKDGVKIKFKDEDILSILEPDPLGSFTQKLYLNFVDISNEDQAEKNAFSRVQLITRQKSSSGEVLFSDNNGKMIVQYYGWNNFGPAAGVLCIIDGFAYRIGTVGGSPIFQSIEAHKRSDEVTSLVLREFENYPKIRQILTDYFGADSEVFFPKEDLKSVYFDCYFEQSKVPSLSVE